MTVSTTTQHRIGWVIRLLLVLAFGAAGAAKLAGAAQMVQIFEHIGIGQWFRYVTGLVEVAGAVLLLIPGAAFFGGVLLAVTMLFGIATHLFVIGGNPVPALVLALLSAYVAYSLRHTAGVAASSGATR